MALETLEIRIIVPGTFAKIFYRAIVNRWIGALYAIRITMATRLRAGILVFRVAGGARLDIHSGGLGVSRRIDSRIPKIIEVIQRNGSFLSMARFTEGRQIVATLAVRFLALGFLPVIETEIQAVNITQDIFAGMAIAAEGLRLMAGETVLAVGASLEFMTVIPVRGMYHLGHLRRAGVTDFAIG